MADDPHRSSPSRASRPATPQRAAKAADLFDLRRLIGGLFLIYGRDPLVLGLGESDASIEKSAGVNVNLYAGLGHARGRRLFIAWALARPLGDGAEAESDASRAGGARGDRVAPSGRAAPGGNSASTAPPKPPPIIRAPAAPAALRRSTVASTSGTDAS